MTKKEIEIATAVANAVSHGETRICVDYEGLEFLSRYEMTEVVCSLFEVYGATQATQLMLAIFPFWMDLPYIKWLDIVTMLDQHDLALLWGVAPLMYKFLCVDVYECLVAEKIELKSMERLKENRDQEHSLYKCMDAVKDDFIYNERELSYLGVEKKSIYLMRERLYKEGAIRSAC